jgi:long-subunit fatty acid transport protein
MIHRRSSSKSASAVSPPGRRSSRAVSAAAFAAALWLWPLGAFASALLAPAVGVPDTALAGTAVALPPTPEGAMFQNPAGLGAFPTTTFSGGFGLGFGKGCVEVPEPVGYDECNRPMPIVPSGSAVFPLGERVRAGIGMFGSTGATFDYDSDPPMVELGFYSETAIVSLPLALAYRVTEKLWVGAEISPLYGYLRNRIPMPEPPTYELARIKYTLHGAGVQGMLGITWVPSEFLALGFGVRTPGAVWLDGSTRYAGESPDVDLVIQMPTQVFLGITARPTPRLEISASVRWTDSSRLGDSDIEFADVELPFVPDAQDEWRTGLGASVRATDQLTLRGGFSYATALVGNEGVSPLLFDSQDWKITAGASYELGAWTLHLTGGYQFEEERTIAPSEALVLPGRYSNTGGIVLFGVVYRR